MDFSNFLDGFVKIDIWISQSCYMDLSKSIHGFPFFLHVSFVLLHILHVFLALSQTKPNLSLTKISKLVEASALN